MKLSFAASKQIHGEADTVINAGLEDVFDFIANNFFQNYPKWATEVIEVEALDDSQIHVGTRGRQIREDNGSQIESIFEIVEYNPNSAFSIQGLSTPYKQMYLTHAEENLTDQTTLKFRFDLLEMEIFMRPFEKLIRVAIEEGAEKTVEKIKDLIHSQQLQAAS